MPVPESIARWGRGSRLHWRYSRSRWPRGSPARDGGATAQAFALKVVVPGAAGAATTVVAAPVDSVSFGNAGAFPSMDVVSWGGSVASASASPGQLATANASAEVTSLSLFQ